MLVAMDEIDWLEVRRAAWAKLHPEPRAQIARGLDLQPALAAKLAGHLFRSGPGQVPALATALRPTSRAQSDMGSDLRPRRSLRRQLEPTAGRLHPDQIRIVGTGQLDPRVDSPVACEQGRELLAGLRRELARERMQLSVVEGAEADLESIAGAFDGEAADRRLAHL